MYIPIILGIILGILTCFFIKNSKTFGDPFILFGIVYTVIVFSYIALKNCYISFIKKHPLKFLAELLFIGVFTYLYCIIVYHFRGISIEKDHYYIIIGIILFFIIHTLLELGGVLNR